MTGDAHGLPHGPLTKARPCLGLGVREDAGVDGYLAARQRKGIHGLGIIDDRELPGIFGFVRNSAMRVPTPFTRALTLGSVDTFSFLSAS
ncbi:MAG: hypothetical protein MZV63_57720 [Marinilabiliales bacterium]|nr:hypothetical protein [Marinilabiliales bacterium]